jgi:hypothetical protein
VQALLYNRSPDKIVAQATNIGYNTKYSGLHKNRQHDGVKIWNNLLAFGT